MNLFSTARRIYSALASDSDAEAQIRTELKTLALAIALEPNKGFDLTSSSVNGQSFSGTRTITNNDRLTILTEVVKMFDKGGAISSKATPLF